MYVLKSFMAMSSLEDNRPDKTAPFGELTTQARTYTRDIRTYAGTAYPDVCNNVFRCVDEMLARVEPSPGFQNEILALGQWVFQQHMAKVIPSDANKAAFIVAIQEQFPEMKAVTIGEILVGNHPDMRMPDYISFKMLDNTIQYQVTVWFAGDAFDVQYDEFEVFVVPPLADINQLIDNKPAVDQKLKEQLPSTIINRIQEIRGDKPETALIPLDLTWHDPNDFNATMLTTWTAVIYGPAGTDREAIKDAIREYISENSTYTKWPEIYPELYSENEFVLMPMWDELALMPNALEPIGFFSTIIKMDKFATVGKRFLPTGYSQSTNVDQFLKDNLEIGGAAYRAIMFCTVGNPNNKDDVFGFRQIFPDYMAIDTANPDFNRMDPETQAFCIKFTDALKYAYSYKPTDQLPIGYTRFVRRGYHYLSFDAKGYSFPILTKFTYDKFM